MKHEYGRCSAFGKDCLNCGKRNHFAVVCRAKKVNEITTQCDDDKTFVIYSVSSGESVLDFNSFRNSSWFENIVVDGTTIRFKLDSGSDVNTLPKRFLKISDAIIRENRNRLEAYGEIEYDCVCGNITKSLRFSIVGNDHHVPLLGLKL